VLWGGGDSLLHVSICHKPLTSQVLLKGSKEMETTGHETDVQGAWSITFQPHHRNQSQVWLAMGEPVISISLNPLRSTLLERNLQQMLT